MPRLKRFINTACYLLVVPVIYLLSFLPVMVTADRCGVIEQASYVYYPVLRIISKDIWGPVLEFAGVSDIAVFFLVNLYASFAATIFLPC